MSAKHVVSLIKRGKADGSRYARVYKVNKQLKTRLFYQAIKDFQGLVNWAQFFVFYTEAFNDGFREPEKY